MFHLIWHNDKDVKLHKFTTQIQQLYAELNTCMLTTQETSNINNNNVKKKSLDAPLYNLMLMQE